MKDLFINTKFKEEEKIEEEVLDWYSLSPSERFIESQKLWEVFELFGGNHDPEPDTQSSFNIFKANLQSLLIGGQACILYGAEEFSCDIDITILLSSENLKTLKLALNELNAERIFFPDLSKDVLERARMSFPMYERRC